AAAVVLAAAGTAQAATTAAQVLDANRAAMGAPVDRKGALDVRYDYAGQGMTGEVRSTYDLSGAGFVDSQDVGLTTGGNGFDGRTAWMRDLSGAITPQDGGDIRKVAVTEAYLDGNLWWRTDRGGAKIEVLPPQTSGEAHYDVLRVSPAGGKPFDAWFDVKTHLLARTVENQGFQTIATNFADYRTVGGVMVAGKQVIDDGTGPQFRQTMTLKSVAAGPALPASAYAPPPWTPTDARIANAAGRVTVPMQLLNNHVYLEAKINGKGPFLCIFDTGGHSLLTPETAKALAVHAEGDAPGTGAGEGVVTAGFAKGVDFQIGDLTFSNQTVTVLPFASKAVEGFDEQGMLGFELARRFVTVIDYGAKTITFIDPTKFDHKDAGTPVPFAFYNHLPQVAGVFEGVPGTFDIDTGSRVELTLTKPFVEAHGLTAKHPKGVLAVDGWGVGGPSRSYVTRGDYFMLGPVRIDGLVASFGTQGKGAFSDPNYQGNVGSGLLKRFAVTFDYGHQVMYLKPLQPPAGDVGVFDRAGFWLNQSPAGFKVMDLTAGSAAADTGLKVGDEITAVDGVAAPSIDLPQLRRRLRDEPAGTQLKLDVLAGGQARTVTLTLRDQI
ncbi:MAG TPA: aspartyl protease family protein, partial [Caulobacteraceae bacterium]|nr:aspartyl protease family protein [Caulobacteraceae bacterium]